MESSHLGVTFEKRISTSRIIREKYPELVPVIVFKPSSEKYITIKKNKYLVPIEYTLRKFIREIYLFNNIPKIKTIFPLINNISPVMDETLGHLYNKHKDPDGFLYIAISTENSFG